MSFMFRYTEMSIWDIHRTQAPLVVLLKPDVSRNIVRSLVGMMKEGACLHDKPHTAWPSPLLPMCMRVSLAWLSQGVTCEPAARLLYGHSHPLHAGRQFSSYAWRGILVAGCSLPRWPIANVFGGSMIATHANQMILDAYIKGVRDFDVEAAYEGMRQQATNLSTRPIARHDLQEWVCHVMPT